MSNNSKWGPWRHYQPTIFWKHFCRPFQWHITLAWVTKILLSSFLASVKGSTWTVSTVYLEGLPTSKTSTFECFFRLSAPFSCSEIDKLLISSRDGCGNLWRFRVNESLGCGEANIPSLDLSFDKIIKNNYCTTFDDLWQSCFIFV